ncbi:PREDICTED: uncharacterized protein LOC104783654 [Camelina sativa]|uniref:Uncharacterized protein LOC104783654 n=1 Tax=Camelina sativa TaxID=90675 RepID=A0ABM0YWV7_CAMSA|nr:PREDICTED: uncharacterized protein LOC104783654 [Camelina sativa]
MGIWNCMGKTSLFIFGLGFYTHAALFSKSDHQTLKTQLESLKETVKVQMESFKEPSNAQMAKYREIEQKLEAKYREMEKKLDHLVKLSTTQIFELKVTKEKCCSDLWKARTQSEETI